MKKITFILFALIAGTTFAQTNNDSNKATGTATVNAEIISPIEITSGSVLNFGRIIGDAEGGTVTVSTAGERSFDNNDLNAPTTTSLPSAAAFKITAENEYLYSISIPSIKLEGAGDDMTVNFEHNMKDEGNAGSGAEQTLLVGGDLLVNGGQDAGEYTGTATVTVSYE
ncbi:DUF4402 domain-containing protein [Salinimicrobium sediminilitoris]|uniref:DUF4402 domain-containing protein n=1 Tax=Salinimicrobium sediminilitoris TaxID=2876715 RepID=UPI001E2DE2E5|nr:DUF4402 domain-containing protein [Salinimicrobium sediminilitoris]MCC8358643.1 DUF4402 domain-containing protein [Salinimicrobium sediminilitoris]